MKDAYDFKRLHFPVKAWAKTIWCKEVPPSKSLLVWRLMQDKIPTDDKLMERGCSLPSICSLCHICSESTFHLFFECNFEVNLWRWLASILGKALHFQSLEDIWKFCDSSWTPQCKVAIKSTVINIMSVIWFARNNARFNNKPTHWKAAVNWIQSNVSLAGNKTSCCSYSSITDFIILKKFNVSIHPPKAPVIKEVIWHPPFGQWVKCNTDGAANNITASCGGIFRNCNSEFLCGFAENIGPNSAFIAELCGAMRAIEIAANHNRHNLWLESDSSLVVLAFKSHDLVSWSLSNRWFNCSRLLRNMNFVVSHIERGTNVLMDLLMLVLV
ncbi:unnamed protein product [Trifolium pratense]|uniref:Uncharacterized protein n=1 Tax=Trifolium pratense TaxID=57577 RepID=A0ACB0LEZ8_TRIPR|nr:unnamed protein product [Trifolium pratense]